MKRWIFGFLLLSVLYSCFHEAKITEDKKCNLFLEPNLRMRNLLDSFVSINGKNNSVNEVFIDKTSPHESNLILHSGGISLTREENQVNNQCPVNEVIVSDVHFMIYSGVENYFTLPQKIPPIATDNKSHREINLHNVWMVRDSGGIFKIEKNQDAYPFLPFPNKTDDIELKYPSIK